MVKHALGLLVFYAAFVFVMFVTIAGVQQLLPCGWLTASMTPNNRAGECVIAQMESLR